MAKHVLTLVGRAVQVANTFVMVQSTFGAISGEVKRISQSRASHVATLLQHELVNFLLFGHIQGLLDKRRSKHLDHILDRLLHACTMHHVQ